MEAYSRPEENFLLDVVYRAADIAAEYQMELGPVCRPCTHNTITVEKGAFFD